VTAQLEDEHFGPLTGPSHHVAGRAYCGPVRFDISIPQRDTDGFDAEGVKSYLARAEELGFEGGWTLEQTIGPSPVIAPMELLAYAAACTTRLRLGVAVLITSLHDPLQLASTVTAVDRLSHGRLDLGVAPGGGFRKFEAFGVQKSTFISSFTEGLELMKAAWSDEPMVTFHGRFRDVDGLPIQPKPAQRPHPPIWFGANAPKAIARAVRLGDAFLGAGSSTTASFAEAVETVSRELEQQGKDPAGFTVGKRVYLMIDDDPARGRERVLVGLHRIYGEMPGIEAVPVSGTAADVTRGLREVMDAGAQMVLLNPVGESVAEDREQMERLAADVIPLLS
jgi:alkanesulfonate monooxygenase SsuD/methylene tetrahydromethanopterin reductase-like flavin-dependent oxidoreductase (luciferase family)